MLGDKACLGIAGIADRLLETKSVELAIRSLKGRVGSDLLGDFGLGKRQTKLLGGFVEHDLGNQLPDDQPVQPHGPGLLHADRAAKLPRILLQPIIVQHTKLLDRNFGVSDLGDGGAAETSENIADPPDREADDQYPDNQGHDQFAEPVRRGFSDTSEHATSMFERSPYRQSAGRPYHREPVPASQHKGGSGRPSHAVLACRPAALLTASRIWKRRTKDVPGKMRRPLVAGNWKMNGLQVSLREFLRIIEGARNLDGFVEVLVCPPATLLADFAAAAEGGNVQVGAQDCHAQPMGAFTGDLSAEMLRDAGARAVILGHSERRTHHNESDADVRAKAAAAHRAGLLPIVCVGETSAEREDARAQAVVGAQLDGSLPHSARPENLVLAYEPVWAIGTGLTPTPDDVAEMHGFIRRCLMSRFGEGASGIRILYGGSVKAANAGQLMQAADVDGALVGGASLEAAEFLAIVRVYA